MHSKEVYVEQEASVRHRQRDHSSTVALLRALAMRQAASVPSHGGVPSACGVVHLAC